MLNETLNWLTSTDGGALILVLWAVSWGLEEASWWHSLQSKVRSLIVLGTSALLAVGAAVLQQNPDVVATIEPYFRPVYFVVLAWVATQTAHKLNPKKGEEN